MSERPSERHTLAHAAREGRHRAVEHIAKAELNQETLSLSHCSPHGLTQGSEQLEILARGEQGVNLWTMAEVSQARAERFTDLIATLSGKDAFSAIGLNETAKHREQGGLAGTVRAEQRHNFTRFDLEIDATKDGVAPVAKGDASKFDGKQCRAHAPAPVPAPP